MVCIDTAELSLSEDSHEYIQALLAMNFILSLHRQLDLRFALARTMSRPAFLDLLNTRIYEDNGLNERLTAEPKSPRLDPFIADQADASLEWYPWSDSSIFLAYYFKDVQAYLTRELINTSVSAIELNDNGDPTGNQINVPLSVQQKVNAKQNYQFQGVEISYQQSFSWLKAPCKHSAKDILSYHI